MSERIEDIILYQATEDRYLNYALSVITSRALPDVRDGLKPVQRRILYAMFHSLKLAPEAKHRKSAAVIGEVMAKYHPHGDQSIYDAMVRMAQDFSLRYPLIDGQGNFGSLDGDGAAAMRYTEARLRHAAMEILTELQKNTVDYRQNYDGTQQEPTVLPAQIPNLLINGASGIAVGMATNIPPHNVKEVINGVIALIDNPDLPLEKIVGKIIKAPDFPTGGEILNTRQELLDIYSKGKGSIDVRGRYSVETEGRRKQIIVNSIPYGVNKATLIGDIADHIRNGRVPQIIDIRDESTEDIRIVIELKRGSNPDAAMAFLFKKTNLQNRFNVNLTALRPTDDPNVCQPERLNLRDMLTYFRDFREEVTRRRLNYDLDVLERRIHILKALAIIFANLDEAIALIRASEGKSDAREKLMAKFELDWDQAEAILEIKLYRLAKLEIESIRAELEEKEAQAAEIRELLGSAEKMWALIRSELEALKDAYGDRRRTKVSGPQEEVSFSDDVYIVAEDTFIMVSRNGWFKRQRSYTDLSAVRVREDDEIGWVVPASTKHTLVLFTDVGRAYTLRVADVPATTGYGEPVQTRFDFADGEHIVGVITSDPRVLPEIATDDTEEEVTVTAEEGEEAKEIPKAPYLVTMTRGGRTARLSLESYFAPSTVNGRIFMRTNKAFKDDVVTDVFISDGTEKVSLATRKGRALVFPVSEIKILSSAGKGVLAVKLQKNDHVLGFRLVTDRMDGLEVETNRGRTEVVRWNKFAVTRRGGKGREIIRMGHVAAVHRKPLELTFRDNEDLELSAPPDEPLEEQEGLIDTDETAPPKEAAPSEPTPPPASADTVPDLKIVTLPEEEDQGDLF
ncbi:MAG: DNA topoisomerase [Myxococcales bacterium]|nr:DNA topoisomerase [Myxococcales bacterium]